MFHISEVVDCGMHKTCRYHIKYMDMCVIPMETANTSCTIPCEMSMCVNVTLFHQECGMWDCTQSEIPLVPAKKYNLTWVYVLFALAVIMLIAAPFGYVAFKRRNWRLWQDYLATNDTLELGEMWYPPGSSSIENENYHPFLGVSYRTFDTADSAV